VTDEQPRPAPEAAPAPLSAEHHGSADAAPTAFAPDEEPLRRPRRRSGSPPDGLAVAAIVVAVAGLSLVAVVLGHLALHRIDRRGSGGRWVAVAALVLGYAGLVLFLAWWAVYFAVLAPIVTLPG
jgi:ferric-dicitrate binding protein FerR (iron transport regulator)